MSETRELRSPKTSRPVLGGDGTLEGGEWGAEAKAGAPVCLLGIPWKGAEAADQSSLGEKSQLLGTELPRGSASAKVLTRGLFTLARAP